MANTTGIQPIGDVASGKNIGNKAWYDLQECRISGENIANGIYLYQKKMMIFNKEKIISFLHMPTL